VSTGTRKVFSRNQFLRLITERRSASAYGLVVIAVCGLLGGLQTLPNGPLVTAVALIAVYEFQKRLDQGVPLLQLTALIAVLQWLVGPVLNYSSDYEYGRYQMYVAEDVYFQYALPATCLYVAVMLAVGRSVLQKDLLRWIDRRNFVTIAVALNAIALVAAMAATRVEGNTQFFFHLLSQLRYVGAIYFLFSHHQLRLLLAAASLSPLLLGSLSNGMFHDLLLWVAIIFCYWFAQRKWELKSKLLVLSLAGFALFSIQAVKLEYREQMRQGTDPSLIELLVEYLTPGGKAWESDSLSLVITRLNQGWIISAVLDNVPAEEPFADGETLKEAFVASLVPRFLMPDKVTAGGRENFRRFTGLQIANSTSMGISPLGEAYANFGDLGGIVLMVLYGLVYSGCFYVAVRFVSRHPTFFFWLPLIFYQAIKAETEFGVVLNQLAKGGMVAIAGYYFIQMNFPARIKRPIMVLQPRHVPATGRPA
jgi:hypothetical protein